MSVSGSYIPVSELAELEHPEFAWRVALPEYAPADDILVNADRIRMLARLGGMRSIAINSYSGDITKTTVPNIASIDDHGTAAASRSVAISVAETQHAQASKGNNYLYEYFWADGNIALNVAEIEERVAQRGNLRSPKFWSKQIDSALRQGIKCSGQASLIENVPRQDVRIKLPLLTGLTAAAILFTGVITEQYADQSVTTPAVVATALTVPAIADHLLNKYVTQLYDEKPKLKDMKLAWMPPFPFDRYLAMRALTKILPVVKTA